MRKLLSRLCAYTTVCAAVAGIAYATDVAIPEATAKNDAMLKASARTLPYYADFKADWEDYTVLNLNNDQRFWCQSSNGADKFATLQYAEQGSADEDDWLISPAFSFEQGKTYIVKFQYKGSNVTFGPNKLEVKFGNDNTPEAMTGTLLALQEINTADYISYEYTINASESGSYYIGFHACSPAYRDTHYIKDFSVVEKVGNGAPLAPESVVSKTSSTLGEVIVSWDPVTKTEFDNAADGVTYTVERRVDGQWLPILENTADTKYNFMAVANGQEFVELRVKAIIGAEESNYTYANVIPVGTPIAGLDESFEDGEFHNLWYFTTKSNVYWSIEKNMSGDDDNYTLLCNFAAVYLEGEMYSGLVSLAGFAHPTFEFMTYNQVNNDTNIRLYVRDAEDSDSEFEQVFSGYINELAEMQNYTWAMVSASLQNYAGKTVQFKITTYCYTNDTYIDAIHVVNDEPKGVNISLDAPLFVTPGEEYTITATVVNDSESAIEGVNIDLMLEDVADAISSKPLEVAAGETATVEYNLVMPKLQLDTFKYYVCATLAEETVKSEIVYVMPDHNTVTPVNVINAEDRSSNEEILIAINWEMPEYLGFTDENGDYHATGDLSLTGELLGYRLYRNGELIANENTLDAETLEYLDRDVVKDLNYFYQVSAVYEKGESRPTSPVFILATGIETLQNSAILPDAVYTLSGERVNGNVPTPGLYIILKDGKARKVIK